MRAKLNWIPALVPIGFLWILILGNAVYQTGCKTPEMTAYKTIGTQIISVEAGKKAVAEAYVAGQVSEKNFQTIRAACDRYDASVKVEQSAVIAYKTGTDTNSLNRAMIAVSAASADALSLMLRFLPPDKAAKLKGL
jgi:hypothetical protein